MRIRTAAVLAVVLVVVAGAVAYFSPVLSVRSVVVRGQAAVSEQDVVAALSVAAGTPLLQVDLAAAAARVAALPKVRSARVERVLPSTVRVSVRERSPAVWVSAPDGPHLLDDTGVDYVAGAPPPGVPQLVVAAAGPADSATRAALAVLGALPPQLRTQVVTVGARTPSAVELTLGQDRTVRWGTVDQSARKAAVLTALLTRTGRIYDVSSPALPTVR